MSSAARQELEELRQRLRRPLDSSSAGGACELTAVAPTQKLLRLISPDGVPKQVLCLIGIEQSFTPPAYDIVYTSPVVDIVWGVGRGGGTLRCDLPCLVSIPAADFFEATVSYRSREDDSLAGGAAASSNQWRVEGSCCFTSSATQGSAQRTHDVNGILAGVASTIRAIPAYAKRVRLLCTEPDELANVQIQLFTRINSTALPGPVIRPASDWCPVPGGCISYRLLSTTAIDSISIIWELLV